MGSTESQNATSTKLKRISWLSQRDSGKVFHNLIHLFNEDSLRDCFNELDGKKAVGTDGISKEQYRFNLDENLRDLVSRMKRMAYKPGPVREVLIPKPGRPKEKRPLGICNFEDIAINK
jgi:retron-type reverse transcriptase